MQNADRSVVKSASNRHHRQNNKTNGVSSTAAMGLGVSTSSRSNNDRSVALSQSSSSSTDSDRSCRQETIDCLTESEDENSEDEINDQDLLKFAQSKSNQSLNNSLWELSNKGRFRDIIEASGVLDFSTLDMKDSSVSQFFISLNESLANSEKELEKRRMNKCVETSEEVSEINRQLKIIGFLRRACEMKDLDAIDLVTRYITDEDGKIESSDSLLCSAATQGCYTLCECLIEMGMNVDDRSSKNNYTPLMEASEQNFVDIVDLLCRNGANVNAKSVDSDTPLHLAASCGHLEVVKLLLQYNANIEEHNENGHTPLMKAACGGHIEVAKFLIERGAGVNQYSNDFKETAFTLAAYKGQLEMVKFLLNNGANCDHKTEEMHTAFMEAAMGGHVEVGKLLLDIGVQVNMPPQCFESPLTLAACGGHIEFADLLLNHGADIEEKDDEGLTPLMEAAREDHIDMVQFLISKGANIHTRTKIDHDVFVLACKHGRRQIAELLVMHGAVVDREIEGGYSALLLAAKHGHYSTVQYLIEQGANVNKSTNNNEETVLSAAVFSGNVHVVHLLLKHYADPLFKLQDGTTMLIEAAKGGHADIAKLLFNWLMGESPTPLSSSPSSVAAANNPSAAALMFDNEPLDGLTCLNSNLFIDDGEIDCEEAGARSMEEYQFITKDLPNVPVSMATYAAACDSTQEQNAHSQASSSDNSDDDDDEEEDEDYEETECSVKHGMKALYVKQYRNLQPCSLVSAGHPNQKWKHEHKSGGMLALKKQRLKHQKKPFSSSHQELRFNDGHHLKHFITSSLSSANIPKTKADKKHSRSNTIATSIISASSSLSSSSVPLCGHNHLDHDEETCGMCGCLKAMKTMEEVDRNSQLECQTCPPISTAGRQHPGDDKCCRLHHHQTVCSLHRSIKTMNNNSLQQFSQHSLQQHHQLTSDSSNGCNLTNCVDQCGSNTDCEPIKSQLEAQTVGNLETALTLSCSRGHVELVCLLLSKGSNIEHRDKKGFTPLLHAANFGHSKIVEILVGNGADVEAETERTKDTALSLACASGYAKVVDILARKGYANLEHRNVSDYTPLCQAASGGHVHVIELLLHFGAEINSRTNSKLGISPLMLAAMNGHAEAVSILLDRGSDVNAQIETNRNTALTLACYQGQHEVVSLLADRKANLEHRVKAGLTPLMEAAQGGYVEVGKILLDRGADIGAIPLSTSRDTALGIAAEKGHCAFVELLLSRNAPVDVKNKKGMTALWMACNAGHLDVVKVLVNKGADVDSIDNRKVSCLGAALKKGSEKVVKYLVSQVSQLPSDAECGKLLKSFSEIDKPELKNSCMKCLEIIKKAKEAQAMKAYENATILLNELQQEKKLEAKKRAAREKKREKRKQKKKDRFASGSTTPNSSNLNNNGNPARDSSVDVKTANSSASPGVSDEDKPEPSSRLTASDEEVAGKENNPKCLIASKSSATTNSSVDTNTIDNKKRKSNRIDRGHQSSDVKESTPVPNHKDQVKVRIASNTATSGLPLQESKVQLNQCPEKSRKDSIPLLKTKLSGIGDLDDFALLPSTLHTNIVAAPVLLASLGTQKMKNDSKSAKLPLDNLKETSYTHKSSVLATTKVTPAGISTTTLVATAQKPLLSTIPSQPAPVHVTYKPALALNNVSTNAKSFVKKKITPGSSIVPSSNSVLLKKDDSFLLNKDPQRKTRKVDVPARAVSRVIGRAGCNINAIREFSGAKIDLDKLKTCDDAVVTIRGTNESVNKAGELILALVRESDKDIDQLITAFKQQQLSGGVSLLGSSSSSNSVEVSTTNVWKTGNSLLMKNSITIPSCVSIASTVRESVSLIPPNNVWESRKMQSSLNNEASKTTNNAWLKSTNNKETNSNYSGSRPTVISTLNMSGSNVWDNSMADGIGKAPGSGLSVPEDKPEPITTFPIGAWKSVSKSSDIRSTNSFAHSNDSVPNVQSPSNHPSNAKEDFSWVKAQDAPTTTFSETIIRTTAAVSMTQSTLMPAVSVANTSSSSTSDSTSLSSTSSSVQQFLSYQANPQSPLLHSYSGKLPSSIAPISAVQEPAAEYSPFGDYGSSFLNNSVVTTSSSSMVSSNLIASHSDVTIDKSKAPGYRPPSFQNRSQSPTKEQLPVFQNNVNVPGFVSACNSLNSDKYSDSNRYVPNDNESAPSSSAYHYLLPSEQQHSIKTTNVESATISVAAAIDNNSSYQSIITPMVNSTLNPNAPNFNSKPTSISPQMFYKSNLPSMYSSGMKYNLQPHLDPSNVPKMHQQQQQNIPINSSNDLQMFPSVNPGYSNIDGSNLTYQGSHQTSMPVEYSQRRFSFSEGIAASNSNKSVVKSNEVNTTSSIYQSPSIHQHSFTPYTTTTLSYQQQRQQAYSVDHYMRRLPGQLQPIGTERNSKKQLVFSAISTSASTLSSSSASPLSLASVSISSPLSSLVTAVQPSVTTIIPLVPKSNLMVAGPVGPTVADHLANNMVAPPWNYHPGLSRSSTNTAQQLNNNTAMLNIPSSTYLYNNVYNNNVGSSAAAAAAAASTRPAQVFNHHGPAYSPNLNNLPSNQYVIPNGSTLSSAYHGRLTPQLHPQQHYQQQQQLQQPQQQQNSFFYPHSSSYPRFPHEMEGWQMGVHENHGDDLQAWNLWNSVDNSRK